MIQIRQEQLDAMPETRLKDFIERLTKYVRTSIPAAAQQMTDNELRSRIRKHVSAAHKFGLDAEDAVAKFVCLCFLPIQRLFYELPEVQRVFQLPFIDPDSKIRMLSAELKRRRSK